jgi:hypothetical protein
VFQGLFKVVKPGEYLGGVFIRSFELASAALKSCKNNIWFKVVSLPMQLKVLIHSPMQLKMVQQQLLHLQLHKVTGYSTKTSTKKHN